DEGRHGSGDFLGIEPGEMPGWCGHSVRQALGNMVDETPYRRRWDEVNRHTARKSYPANPRMKNLQGDAFRRNVPSNGPSNQGGGDNDEATLCTDPAPHGYRLHRHVGLSPGAGSRGWRAPPLSPLVTSPLGGLTPLVRRR